MVVVLPNPDGFPFLLGRAFIEAFLNAGLLQSPQEFPFLLGRAFIEAFPF